MKFEGVLIIERNKIDNVKNIYSNDFKRKKYLQNDIFIIYFDLIYKIYI